MRENWILAFGALVLAVAGYLVLDKERIIQGGETVYLELAPVDPRSLMQGDYMALRFAAARAASRRVEGSSMPRTGHLVLSVDDRGVARFQALDRGQELEPEEIRLRYHSRNGDPAIATNAYFFQEGTADSYEEAAFGVLRITEDGRSVLVGLADENLEGLGPGNLQAF
ncbi:MAG: GDYXXLXY domain-containing protein [Thiohalorhabdus sp.]